MQKTKILPVAIMAHNEEMLIATTIKCCFNQILPDDYTVYVIVVANGCTDNTEKAVLNEKKKYNDNLILISTREKGKTRALNTAIDFIKNEFSELPLVQYVIFMDADCEYNNKHVFEKYVRRFNEISDLCVVGATIVPNIASKLNNSPVVRRMYMAIYELGKLLQENGISGGSYCIKKDVLSYLKFPNLQLADDLYVCWRFDGCMYRDPDIEVYYDIPSNIRKEYIKRVRQSISTINFTDYVKSNSEANNYGCIKLIDDKYRWRGYSNVDVVFKIIYIKGLVNKILILINIIIRLFAVVAAKWHFIIKPNISECDYWKVER